ncbi:MAG: tetratricopeptide repeat protein [Chloroflexota bacterium]
MRPAVFVFCAIISLGILLHPAAAQTGSGSEDDETRIIPVAFAFTWEDDSPFAEQMIDQLQTAFAELSQQSETHEIILEDDPENVAVIIMLDALPDDDIIFLDLVALDPAYGRLPSPAMIPHVITEFPLAASLADPAWPHIGALMSVALGAYAAGDCQMAEDYFERAQAETATLQETFFIGQAAQTEAYFTFYDGACDLMEGDYENAAEAFEQVLAIYAAGDFDPTLYGFDAAINLAFVSYQLGDPDTARDLLAPITASRWYAYDAYLMRAEVNALAGDTSAALNDLAAAEALTADLQGDDPDFLLVAAHVYTLSGEFDAAAAVFSTINKSLPGLPEALYYRGLYDYARGDTAAALQNLNDYLAAVPDHLTAAHARSIIAQINSEE